VIQWGSDRLALALMLSVIRREVNSLRADVAELDLPSHEAARFLDALSTMERRTDALAEEMGVVGRGH
jgi:hypothetical protein